MRLLHYGRGVRPRKTNRRNAPGAARLRRTWPDGGCGPEYAHSDAPRARSVRPWGLASGWWVRMVRVHTPPTHGLGSLRGDALKPCGSVSVGVGTVPVGTCLDARRGRSARSWRPVSWWWVRVLRVCTPPACGSGPLRGAAVEWCHLAFGRRSPGWSAGARVTMEVDACYFLHKPGLPVPLGSRSMMGGCRAVLTVFFQTLYLAIQKSSGRSDTGFGVSWCAPTPESMCGDRVRTVTGVDARCAPRDWGALGRAAGRGATGGGCADEVRWYLLLCRRCRPPSSSILHSRPTQAAVRDTRRCARWPS